MFFGRIAAQLLAFAAIAGVFGEIPIISDYAFWFMVGAYLLWLGVNRRGKKRIKPKLMLSLLLTMVAILGVFIEIPMVSNFAFWIMAASYVIMVASTDIFRTSADISAERRRAIVGCGFSPALYLAAAPKHLKKFRSAVSNGLVRASV